MDACKECLGSEQNKEPVCGSDNRTYINACLLKCASCQNPAQNIQEQCKGQCPCKNCNAVCPDIWNPVCGSNGQTYSNPCHLDVTACLNPGLNITLQCQGECPCNIPPTPTPMNFYWLLLSFFIFLHVERKLGKCPVLRMLRVFAFSVDI